MKILYSYTAKKDKTQQRPRKTQNSYLTSRVWTDFLLLSPQTHATILRLEH